MALSSPRKGLSMMRGVGTSTFPALGLAPGGGGLSSRGLEQAVPFLGHSGIRASEGWAETGCVSGRGALGGDCPVGGGLYELLSRCDACRPGAAATHAIDPCASACLSSPCCMKGSEAGRGSREQSGVWPDSSQKLCWAPLSSCQQTCLGLWAPTSPCLCVGPAPSTNSLSTAFLGGFGSCTPSWRWLLKSSTYTGPSCPGCPHHSCWLTEVKLIFPVGPSGCGRKSPWLRRAGLQCSL